MAELLPYVAAQMLVTCSCAYVLRKREGSEKERERHERREKKRDPFSEVVTYTITHTLK